MLLEFEISISLSCSFGIETTNTFIRPQEEPRAGLFIASHSGVFRGARFSYLPTNVCSTETTSLGRDERRAPLNQE